MTVTEDAEDELSMNERAAARPSIEEAEDECAMNEHAMLAIHPRRSFLRIVTLRLENPGSRGWSVTSSISSMKSDGKPTFSGIARPRPRETAEEEGERVNREHAMANPAVHARLRRRRSGLLVKPGDGTRAYCGHAAVRSMLTIDWACAVGICGRM
jgi:hypothetical protein